MHILLLKKYNKIYLTQPPFCYIIIQNSGNKKRDDTLIYEYINSKYSQDGYS